MSLIRRGEGERAADGVKLWLKRALGAIVGAWLVSILPEGVELF